MAPRSATGARLGLLVALAAGTGALLAGLLLPIVGSAGLVARSETRYFDSLSTDLCQPSLPQTSKILDARGNVIAHFYAQNRRIVKLSQVPQIMQNALIAIEDVRFYADNGIDLKGSMRALLANGSSGSVQQGGSTLTQQYVKNVLEACHVKGATSDTLSRKIREAAIALHVARTLTKQQVLQGYLNIVNFGDGAYGIGAAAEHYFGEPVQKLNLTQSALLAGLVQAPSAYDPHYNPHDALARRNVVLGQMLKYNFIDQQQYDTATAKPLGLHLHNVGNGCDASKYPWFCSYVESVLDKEIGARQLLRGGLTVHTTLRPKVQRAASEVMRERVPAHNSQHVEGSEVLIQPGSGHVEAIAVSRKYGLDPKKGETTINYAVDAPYGGGVSRGAVGSTFKVFVLAQALREGLPLSTSINSPPALTNFTGYTNCQGDADVYPSIHNAGADEAGNFNLVTGTWFSVNTFYAQLEQRVGECQVAKLATSLGVRQGNGQPLVAHPSMVLGSQDYGLSAMDMAAAYATFAAHGRYCPPVVVTSITDSRGRSVPLPDHSCTQALDPGLADTVSSILEGVLTHPGATAANVGDPGRPAAAKTGTADNDAVSAFAGYVPQLAGFIWVGRPGSDHNEPLDNITLGKFSYPGQVFGATIAGPMWKETFEKALAGVPVESLPTAPSQIYVNGKQSAIPDVSGVSAKSAEATLRQDGFTPVLSGTQVPSYLPAGTVAYTSPPAGTQGTPGTAVTIYLSNGQPPANSAPANSGPNSGRNSGPNSSPNSNSKGPTKPTSSPPVPPPAHSPPGHSTHPPHGHKH